MKINRTIFLAILTSTFFMGAIVVFGGGLYMLEVSHQALRQKQQEAALVEAKEIGLTQLERELAATAEDREALKAFLLRPGSTIEFLALLDALGDSGGVEVETASIAVAEESPLLNTITIDMKASGSLSGVLHVLALLETLPYASEVTSVSLQVGSGESATMWEGDFTLRIAERNDI